MAAGELACTYAALILHDDGIPITTQPARVSIYFRAWACRGGPPITSEKISTIVKAAGITVEAYWPTLFAKLLEKQDVDALISNVGSGGGGGGAVAAAPAAGGGGAAPAEEKKEEKKEEVKEESDDDMGFSLFD